MSWVLEEMEQANLEDKLLGVLTLNKVANRRSRDGLL